MSVPTNREPGPLPFFLAPPFLRSLGLAALVALAGELTLFPKLIPLDAAVWYTLLFWRGCRTDEAVEAAVSGATRGTIALLGVATLLALRRDGFRATWPPLAVCAVGLHVGKAIKNVFTRERPSSLPDLALGYSFPSAHVMNTALAGMAVIVLAAGFRHPRRWWAMSAVLVAVIFSGRLLFARHWLLDAVGGLLAALALTGLALPWFRRRPLLAPAGLAVTLTLLLLAVLHRPDLRIRLPSPLSGPGPGTITIDLGARESAPFLRGGWAASAPGEETPGGSQVWLTGPGMVNVQLPGGSLDPLRGAVLTLTGRPDSTDRRCIRVRLAVNDEALPVFVPFRGWREYRLSVPPGRLRSGANEVRIEVADDRGQPSRFALGYLRLEIGWPSSAADQPPAERDAGQAGEHAQAQSRRDVGERARQRPLLQVAQRLVVERRVGRETAEHPGRQGEPERRREEIRLEPDVHDRTEQQRSEDVHRQRAVGKLGTERREDPGGEQETRAGAERAAKADPEELHQT